MSKQNCWEFKSCGREPGGPNIMELGVCPAATFGAADGIHGGKNGGRACWGIVGTLCAGKVQDTYAAKLHQCVGCDFRDAVTHDEGALLSPHEISARVQI